MDTREEVTGKKIAAQKAGNTQKEDNLNFNPPVNGDEIDLGVFIRSAWSEKKVVIYTVLVMFCVGLLIAILSTEEYESSIVLMPQAEGNNAGGSGASLLKQFGGMAGFSMANNGGGAIGPELYPSIIESTPFNLHLLNQTLYFSSRDSTLNLYDYLLETQKPTFLDSVKKYTIGLPKMLIHIFISWFVDTPKAVSGNTPSIDKSTQAVKTDSSSIDFSDINQKLYLNRKQLNAIAELSSRISLSTENSGMIKVTVLMPDAMAAAELTQISVDYLTRYLTEYRIEKAKDDLIFIENQYLLANDRYIEAQQELAVFRDKNINVVTAVAETELERLRMNFSLASNIFQNHATQYEQAKIKVQQVTPVFKVLEPVRVPIAPSEPNREFILIAAIFGGMVVGFGIVFIKVFYKQVINQ